jgi:hypothetical protein
MYKNIRGWNVTIRDGIGNIRVDYGNICDNYGDIRVGVGFIRVGDCNIRGSISIFPLLFVDLLSMCLSNISAFVTFHG